MKHLIICLDKTGPGTYAFSVAYQDKYVDMLLKRHLVGNKFVYTHNEYEIRVHAADFPEICVDSFTPGSLRYNLFLRGMIGDRDRNLQRTMLKEEAVDAIVAAVHALNEKINDFISLGVL